MSRPFLRAALPLALSASLLALTACGNKPAAQGAPPMAEVSVVTLKPESVTLTRELTGRAEASQVAEVRPQAGGIVERLLFTEGGSVKAGQPLYQLDQTAYRADANSASASVARAQAELVNAQKSAKRAAELAKTQMISGQDNDNAQAALRQAEAGLRAAQAGLQSANVPLGFTRVTAPISGRIGRSSVTRGALVTASQAAPLAVIQNLDPMYVAISQSSTELLQLRREIAAGNLQGSDAVPVDLLLEDGSRYPQQGKLSFAEATVDPATGAVALRVIVPNPDQLLLPGMFVRATLANAQRKDAILAPQQGITRDPKGNATAMVVGSDGKVEQRQVVVNRAIGNKWLVDSGLAAGDKLIVEGLQKIAPGAPVKVTEASAPTASKSVAAR
ncbi:MAG: efflux RND transporter periplasmic adaptor subunit [Thermomonas sp.]|uniref:efflux RND transporter periplasmic adaptor subunit n=1 Tax=Thermomonas sp. TaxID=1971895 RepID=UPI001ECD974F|nr:efflux RND transporter periplasmic adaptor subunit [Thermomonas sp.]MBV2208972.1 efflux RND transporter periplasmic adaptor subunit [Thermomonas sp.]